MLQTVPNTGADGVLQPDDTILEWDGFAVDSQGYYEDPDYGRLLLPHLISGRRRPGDKVPVTLIRGQQRKQVTLTLSAARD